MKVLRDEMVNELTWDCTVVEISHEEIYMTTDFSFSEIVG